MKKALKVVVKMVGMCAAIGLVLAEVDYIKLKINTMGYKKWKATWDAGYKSGHRQGRWDGLNSAYFNGYITRKEHDELVKKI